MEDEKSHTLTLILVAFQNTELEFLSALLLIILSQGRVSELS